MGLASDDLRTEDVNSTEQVTNYECFLKTLRSARTAIRVREHDCLSTVPVAAADDGEKQTDIFLVCYV